VFEQLSVDSKPSIGVGHKFVLIIDGCSNLKVQILKMVPLSCCYCFYFPLVLPRARDADQCLHLVAFPLDEEEAVSRGF
jgi:hypothetical protein